MVSLETYLGGKQMKAEIKAIWQTAINLGFKFNESDAHEMWLAIKQVKDAELKEAEKAIKQNESAIILLAKQRDEMDAELKETKRVMRRCINMLGINTKLANRSAIIEMQLFIEQSNNQEVNKQDKEKGDTEQ